MHGSYSSRREPLQYSVISVGGSLSIARDQQPGVALVQVVHPLGQQQGLADPGERAVRRDDQIGPQQGPVGQFQFAAGTGGGGQGPSDDVNVEFPRPLDQRVIQVGAGRQDQPVPGPELPVHEGAAAGVAGHQRLDAAGPLGGAFLHAEGGQRPQAVLPQPDSGPEHAQRVGALVYAHAPAALGERDAGGEAAQPRAGDLGVPGGHGMLLCVVPWEVFGTGQRRAALVRRRSTWAR